MQCTRVKICGITTKADALVAISAGADAIGLVFYPSSPRAVNIGQAKAICEVLPPFVSVVALVVNANEEFVRELLATLPIDVLQFHGDEPREFCEQFNKPYIKAIRMRPELDLQQCFDEYTGANALLLDAYRPGVPGGTGESFDWDRIPQQRNKPIILAGGLDHKNVVNAITKVQPYAVDVSGGVESSPGQKDAQKVFAFIAAVSGKK